MIATRSKAPANKASEPWMPVDGSTNSTASTARPARIVSFENSNSRIKRHDDEGTIVIQAGYTENLTKLTRGDDESPIVIDNATGVRRWYGTNACAGKHTPIHGRDKVATAAESFAACLRPSDNGRDLVVIASHHDVDQFADLEAILTRDYDVTRNGHRIQCTVTVATAGMEAVGSYKAVAATLPTGKTAVFEFGFKTCEALYFTTNGVNYDGGVYESLSVSKVADDIAANVSVRAALGYAADSKHVDSAIISAALSAPTLGKLTEPQWTSIKTRYAKAYLEAIEAFFDTKLDEALATIDNIVFTGGGAAFLLSNLPYLADTYIFPANPSVASVVGTYNAAISEGV